MAMDVDFSTTKYNKKHTFCPGEQLGQTNFDSHLALIYQR
jgi:hypothetical protein